MSERTIIKICSVRARDLLVNDIVRFRKAGHAPGLLAEYQHVLGFSETLTDSDDEEVLKLWEELDGRYVIVRLSQDPNMVVGKDGLNGHPRAWQMGAKSPTHRTKYGPGDFEDVLVALLKDQLVEIQMEVRLVNSGLDPLVWIGSQVETLQETIAAGRFLA